MANRREVTDRVLDIIATESYVNDEQLGLLLLKERDLEQALRVLAFLIMRTVSYTHLTLPTSQQV